MIKLITPENEAEANVIKSILEENGIYAEIKSFHDTAYDGLFQSQYGWGLIRVSEADLPECTENSSRVEGCVAGGASMGRKFRQYLN